MNFTSNLALLRTLALSFPLALSLTLPGAAGCGDDSLAGSGGAGGQGGDGGVGASPHPDPEPLPPLSAAPLTTERTLTYPAEAPAGYDVKIPEDVAELLANGFGQVGEGPGEGLASRTMDDAPAPAPGPNARLVTRFVHLADTQLADDESPARVTLVDAPRAGTSGAFRPQEAHACHILNAAVRTINGVHRTLPIEMVILGGDNTDNAQTNEVDWFQAVLDGSKRVECDSGVDDDPTPGPENDPKDPLHAEGLAMPWKWVTGNHDVLNQGNFTVEFKKDEYLSDFAGAGTRDWSQPGGPITKGLIAPDERRAALPRAELLAKVAASGDGHGIDDAVIAYGKAFYSFDLGESVRVLVLDTSAADSGGADGLLLREDLQGFVVPALQRARDEGKKVILTSHHASAQLQDGDVFGGQLQPTAVLPEELQATIGQFDNVLMYLAGHTHIHRVRKIEPAGGHAYWEAESSALADFPHQMRLIEIHDMDNGSFMIRLIGLDFSTESDPVAAEGKAIGVVDYTAQWADDARGTPEDRNVELWIDVSAAP